MKSHNNVKRCKPCGRAAATLILALSTAVATNVYSTDILPTGNHFTPDGDTTVTTRNIAGQDNTRRTRAEYPGGNELLHKFFDANINPKLSHALGKSGKVVVRFFVEKDGSLTNMEIIEHGTPDMDAEVMNVMRKMPRWNPATRDGKPVRSRYRQTFNFNSNKGAGYKPDMKKVAEITSAQGEEQPATPLYIINGRKAGKEEMDKIDALKIVSMKTLPAKKAVKLYGKEGRNGAIVVITE